MLPNALPMLAEVILSKMLSDWLMSVGANIAKQNIPLVSVFCLFAGIKGNSEKKIEKIFKYKIILSFVNLGCGSINWNRFKLKLNLTPKTIAYNVF